MTNSLPKISQPLYELTLPSNGKKIRYRPFLSKEEKILLMALEGNDTKEINLAIKQILNNCLQTQDVDVDSLPTFDIEYFFLNLRSKSVGETVKIIFKGRENTECEECKKSKPVEIKLSDVSVVRDPKNSNTIQLTDDITIILKYPTLEFLSDHRIDNHSPGAAAAIFEAVADSISKIYTKDGKEYDVKDYDRKDLLEFLEGLSIQQFAKIEEFFDSLPKLSYEVNLDCKVCGAKESHKIEGLQSFFG